MVERRYGDAAREYTALNDGSGACTVGVLPPIANAYDAAGRADSVIAIYTRYADGFERPLGTDATFLALALRRLAELHDGKGDAKKALSYYARFIELWKDADPDLQPHVRKARARMAELQRRQG